VSRRVFIVADCEADLDAAPAGDVHRASAIIVAIPVEGWRIVKARGGAELEGTTWASALDAVREALKAVV
jgi:hypothetical protein